MQLLTTAEQTKLHNAHTRINTHQQFKVSEK